MPLTDLPITDLPPIDLPQTQTQPAARLARRFGAGALVIAVLVGVQLGSIPWRYRRQIWQLQGFLLGAAVGYVMGRVSRESRGKGSSPGGSGPSLPPPP